MIEDHLVIIFPYLDLSYQILNLQRYYYRIESTDPVKGFIIDWDDGEDNSPEKANRQEIILDITNIRWNLEDDSDDNLPKELELKWGSKKWSKPQVINWLCKHFNNAIDNCEIEKLVIKEDTG